MQFPRIALSLGMLAVTALSACGDNSEASGKPATSVTSKPEFALYALSRGKGVPAPTRAALEKAHVLLEDARQRGDVLALKQTRIGLEGETRLCVEAKDAAAAHELIKDVRAIGRNVDLFNVVEEPCSKK